MAVAPSMDTAGDATRVPAHTSDLIELVSGVCQVRCCCATGLNGTGQRLPICQLRLMLCDATMQR